MNYKFVTESLHQALLTLQQLEVKGSQAHALAAIMLLVAQAGKAVEDGEKAAAVVEEKKEEAK